MTNQKPPSKTKLYVVRKYIRAKSAAEAIRKDRITAPDDVWVDDDWRKNNTDRIADAIGFGLPKESKDNADDE